MAVNRMTRVNELIKRALAEDFYRELATEDFDLAQISVARVQTSSDLRDAYVYVSIFGHHEERDAIIRRLQDRHAVFQHNLSRQIKLRYTPRLWFRLDESIEQGDHILGIIAELEKEAEQEQEENP